MIDTIYEYENSVRATLLYRNPAHIIFPQSGHESSAAGGRGKRLLSRER